MATEARTIAVLKGGYSAEREVSLRSGEAVARGLREAGCEVDEVDVTAPEPPIRAGVEAAFIALHGEYGEDGGIQQYLERIGLPYTGSDPVGSRAAFDKILTKEALARAGLPTAPYEILGPDGARSLPLPVVVKPPRQGSSLGLSVVRREEEWAPALREAGRYDSRVLVEAFIEGRELTVGAVDGEALPAVEIRAPGGTYDYRAKYVDRATEYLVPAALAPGIAAEVGRLALRTFEALGCGGFGRVDFRLDSAGRLFILELNSIPGFTETSLLPKAAAAAGLSFSALCDRILSTARLHGDRMRGT
jgi:D-alanine-D-alanine ligase